MMSDYKYKDLEADGYEKFSISSADQNRIFKYRKSRWSIRYEYYIKENHIVMQAIPNFVGCVASTILLPIAILAEGLINYKEVYKDIVLKAWQSKRYGSFSSDDIYNRSGKVSREFDELTKLIK